MRSRSSAPRRARVAVALRRPHVVAIASDVALPAAKVPVVDLNDIEAIADLLLKYAVAVEDAPIMRSA